MTKLLLFLIHSLETIDGNRGSGSLIIKKRIKYLLKKEGLKLRAQGFKEKDVEKRVRHELARVTLSKYRLMIVRMKISYEALLRRNTLTELFMR